MLDVGGFPIGMAPNGAEFAQQSVTLKSADRLLMYSDGLPDAMNEDGDVYGAARLLSDVSDLPGISIRELVRSLVDRAVVWCGEADSNDDISIVGMEVV